MSTLFCFFVFVVKYECRNMELCLNDFLSNQIGNLRWQVFFVNFSARSVVKNIEKPIVIP